MFADSPPMIRPEKLLCCVGAIVFMFLTGCASTPTWSKASEQQRASGDFIYDDAYLSSQQFTNDVAEDADVVILLRHKIHGEPLYGVPENNSQ